MGCARERLLGLLAVDVATIVRIMHTCSDSESPSVIVLSFDTDDCLFSITPWICSVRVL